MQVRIIEDFVIDGDPTPAIAPGTIVEATIDPEYGDAWYKHPETGETWFSFYGDFEQVGE